MRQTGCGGRRQTQCGAQTLREFFQLGVDENPQRLKSTGGRVLTLFAGFDRSSHERGQLRGAGDGSVFCAARHNCFCNSASKPLLAIVTNHLRQGLYVGLLEPLRHAHAARGVHAHIERTVEAETEATLRGVDLRRTHAQIHQHAVQTARSQGVHLRERLLANGKTGVLQALRMGHGLRVPIERNQRGVGGQALQQQRGVAAAAVSRIDEAGQRADTVPQKGIYRFVKQHRGVRGLHVSFHQNEKSLKTSGISPCMAWASWAS